VEPRPWICPTCARTISPEDTIVFTDLTDSIRAHLYGCVMLPGEVRYRPREAREAAQSLVKQSHQLSDAADVRLREAEAALHALRDNLRQAPTRSAH
jgi:hypothetical protein